MEMAAPVEDEVQDIVHKMAPADAFRPTLGKAARAMVYKNFNTARRTGALFFCQLLMLIAFIVTPIPLGAMFRNAQQQQAMGMGMHPRNATPQLHFEQFYRLTGYPFTFSSADGIIVKDKAFADMQPLYAAPGGAFEQEEQSYQAPPYQSVAGAQTSSLRYARYAVSPVSNKTGLRAPEHPSSLDVVSVSVPVDMIYQNISDSPLSCQGYPGNMARNELDQQSLWCWFATVAYKGAALPFARPSKAKPMRPSTSALINQLPNLLPVALADCNQCSTTSYDNHGNPETVTCPNRTTCVQVAGALPAVDQYASFRAAVQASADQTRAYLDACRSSSTAAGDGDGGGGGGRKHLDRCYRGFYSASTAAVGVEQAHVEPGGPVAVKLSVAAPSTLSRFSVGGNVYAMGYSGDDRYSGLIEDSNLMSLIDHWNRAVDRWATVAQPEPRRTPVSASVDRVYGSVVRNQLNGGNNGGRGGSQSVSEAVGAWNEQMEPELAAYAQSRGGSGANASSSDTTWWSDITLFQVHLSPDSAFGDSALVLVDALCICFALFMAAPLVIHRMIEERADDIWDFVALMGLSVGRNLFINFVLDLALYLATLALVVLVAMASNMSFLTDVDVRHLSILLVEWGFGMLAQVYLLATLFKSPFRAVALTYLCIFVLTTGSFAVSFFLLDPFEQAPSFLLLIPLFAFTRGMFLLGHQVVLGVIYQGTDAHQAQLSAICALWMPAGTVLFFALAAFFLVLARPLARRLGRLFCRVWPRPRSRPARSGYQPLSTNDSEDREAMAGMTSSSSSDDAQARQEFELVMCDASQLARDNPLVVKMLRKEFAGVPAVDEVCFHVKRNECFGLLGPNGAGKTTLISMLTGLLAPTSGVAFINGQQLESMTEIQKSIGLCPQFDRLFKNLTVRETLLFFSRIKGIPRRLEAEHVEAVIREVGLEGQARRLSGDLSGGQKRRLSLSVAVTGSPALLFCDEPSTGLDTASTRGLWKIIERFKRTRSIILTSHSMAESEVLCDRIGIMTKGRLTALGTPNDLKRRYARAYKLAVQLAPGADSDACVALVRELIPGVQLVAQSVHSVKFSFQRTAVGLSQLFGELERRKRGLGIAHFGISQAGLEDVFIEIARANE